MSHSPPQKINKNEIGECEISYPLSIEEQRKIAQFLNLIEKRIETQNKIIKYKKSQRLSLVVEILLTVLALVENVLSLNIFSFVNNLIKLAWTIFKEVNKLWSRKKP